MVSRSLRSIACVVALGWEGVGCFLIFRVVIQSPRAQDSFCCPSCVCDSNTGGAQPRRCLGSCVGPIFRWGEPGERESYLSHLRLLALTSAQLSLAQWLCVLRCSQILTLGDGLCLPGYNVASHSRAASSLPRGCPSKLDWPHGHHPDCGWRLRTAKTTTKR